jgi:hypothetical protein
MSEETISRYCLFKVVVANFILFGLWVMRPSQKEKCNFILYKLHVSLFDLYQEETASFQGTRSRDG